MDAAEAVIARDGLGGMRLDAVADLAGVSKGGLMHHFPSKDLLVAALVQRMACKWRADYADAIAKTPDGPVRHTRAMILHCFSCPEGMNERLKRTSCALFAALAQDSALVAPLRTVYAEVIAHARRDALPEAVIQTVATTLDGIWLQWMSGLTDLQPERVEGIRQQLEELIARNVINDHRNHLKASESQV